VRWENVATYDCLLSHSAKYYKNPSLLSRVIAKNVGDVFFLRHSVVVGVVVQNSWPAVLFL